jgi:hypothetical protein
MEFSQETQVLVKIENCLIVSLSYNYNTIIILLLTAFCLMFIIFINLFICFPSLSFSFKLCIQLCDDVCARGVQVVNYSVVCSCKMNCIILNPRIYCNTNNRKIMSILGFRLWSRESETTRNVHRKLVSSISW